MFSVVVVAGVAGTAGRIKRRPKDKIHMYSMVVEVGVAGTASRGGDLRIRYVHCSGRDRSCCYSWKN